MEKKGGNDDLKDSKENTQDHNDDTGNNGETKPVDDIIPIEARADINDNDTLNMNVIVVLFQIKYKRKRPTTTIDGELILLFLLRYQVQVQVMKRLILLIPQIQMMNQLILLLQQVHTIAFMQLVVVLYQVTVTTTTR